MGLLDNDNYPTPVHLVEAITQFCFELFPKKQIIIEPSCGEGRFIQAAMKRWGTAAVYTGIDLVPDYEPAVKALGVPFVHADFVGYAPLLGHAWFNAQTLVVTNPPYANELPQAFIEAISNNAEPGCHIALLLRHSFLGGIERALEFKYADSLRIKRDIAGRPKFNVNSKSQDHSEYAVYIYEVGYSGHYLGWKDRLIWKPKHLEKLAKKLAAKAA